MRNFLLVVNPASGHNGYTNILAKTTALIHEKKHAYHILETGNSFVHDIKKLLSQHKDITDIVSIGGDGTLNMVINALPHFDLPISVISNGTGNDSIRSIHGTMDINHQLEIMIEGDEKSIDLGICNDQYFVNGVGMGFDGEVVKHMLKKGKLYQGHMAYFMVVLRLLAVYKDKTMEITVDGKKTRQPLMSFSVTKGRIFGGGFVTNPYAKNDDGKLDLFYIHKTSLVRRLLILSKVKMVKHPGLKEVEFKKASLVEVNYHPHVYAHMDGEFIGNPPFAFSVAPHAIRFKVPMM